jgi:hypothetical protein
MTRRERRRQKTLERHRALAFALVTWPINPTTEDRRREIVLVEAPRWNPDEPATVDVYDLYFRDELERV